MSDSTLQHILTASQTITDDITILHALEPLQEYMCEVFAALRCSRTTSVKSSTLSDASEAPSLNKALFKLSLAPVYFP